MWPACSPARSRSSRPRSKSEASEGLRKAIGGNLPKVTGHRRARLLFATAAALVLVGCVGPSRTAADFESKAKNSASTVRSAVETVRVGLEAAAHGDVTNQYLSVLVGEAEKDASSVEQQFGSVQPPGEESDRLRDDVGETLHQATDTIAQIRIEVRRGEVRSLRDRFDSELADLSDSLQRLSGEAEHGGVDSPNGESGRGQK
jgi:hypothetical protein